MLWPSSITIILGACKDGTYNRLTIPQYISCINNTYESLDSRHEQLCLSTLKWYIFTHTCIFLPTKMFQPKYERKCWRSHFTTYSTHLKKQHFTREGLPKEAIFQQSFICISQCNLSAYTTVKLLHTSTKLDTISPQILGWETNVNGKKHGYVMNTSLLSSVLLQFRSQQTPIPEYHFMDIYISLISLKIKMIRAKKIKAVKDHIVNEDGK